MFTPSQLADRLSATAIAFRGYNVTNLGRTPELLEHPVYGAVVAEHLREASQVCADTLKQPVDLVGRVRQRIETKDLSTYAEDVGLIVAVELAQLKLLERYFGISIHRARLAFGYSLGEAAALIAAGVFEMKHLLPIPVAMAADSVALAENVTMGVLFSRGKEINPSLVHEMCVDISRRGSGVIAISTVLSPNSILLLGQDDTIDQFQSRMREVLPPQVYLRKNPHRWPPLHTSIVWQRAIPNRAAVMLQTCPGGSTAPSIKLLSGVTGAPSYNHYNSRELLHKWVDHPQQLWSLVNYTLADNIQLIIHVGPDPNLIPATFKRLSDNVKAQTTGFSPGRLGLRAVSHLRRRPWLAKLLPSSTALLRAPHVLHLILEDWLLAQKVA